MFKTHVRPNRSQVITFYVKEPLDQPYSSVCPFFTDQDELEQVQFQTWTELGTMLFIQKLTRWEFPIPQVLLLLGEGEHVPKLLITARLSFRVLAKSDDSYTTGINPDDVPYPDKIAVLGTAEECKRGVEKAAAAFPDRFIVGLGSDGNKYLLDGEHGGQRSSGRYLDVDRELKRFGFPMYKEFYHADGEWRAA